MATKETKAAPAAKKAPIANARLTLLTSAAAINKAITSIASRAAKLDREIHVLAVSVVKHTAQHNDPDFTVRFIEAFGKSMRKQAMVAWMLNFGAMTQDEAGKLVYNVKRRDAVLDDANIKLAEETPFWDFAPEQKYVQFDLDKALKALLHKAQNAAAKSEQDMALLSPEKLAMLKQLAGEAE